MAILIPIKKIHEDEDTVVYEYSQPVLAPDPLKPKCLREVGTRTGRVLFHRRSESFTQESGQEWDDGFFYHRVCRKLAEHFAQGGLPDSTSYAA